jgi:hypothetical protein
VLVEAPDLIQHRAAVERRRPARKEGLLGHRKIVGHTSMAALLAAAIAGHEHSGRVQTLLAEQSHLRGAHARIGTLL